MSHVREIGRSYTVEIPILSNTNSKFSFSDNETMLDNVMVTGISVLPSYLGKSPSGKALMTDIDAAKGYLTLCDGNKKEFNKQLPLEVFFRSDSVLHIVPKLISIRNCYVDLPLIGTVAIPAGPPPGLAITFIFFYEPVKQF